MHTLFILVFSNWFALTSPLPLPLDFDQQEHRVALEAFPQVQIVMEYETEKKGKRLDKESGGYTMVFSDSRYAISTHADEQQVQMIMDFDARVITTVTEDKNGEVVAVKMPMIRLGKGALDDFDHAIEQTEEVRNILGYDARKYILRNDGDVTEAWIANVPGLAWGELTEALLGGKNTDATKLLPYIKNMPNAFALESHTTVKGGKKTVHSYVRKLALGDDADLSALEIPAGAEVQDLTSLMKF